MQRSLHPIGCRCKESYKKKKIPPKNLLKKKESYILFGCRCKEAFILLVVDVKNPSSYWL
jgi:hypothetical protein